MSIWTDDPGCGNVCGPGDLFQWRQRARLLASIAGDLGEGAFTQPKLLQLQAVLAEAGVCVECAEELQLLRAAAAPLRDQIVGYARAGVTHDRAQGSAWKAPTCAGPVCTIGDQTLSSLSFDVVQDLVVGVNTPQPLDTGWPTVGVKPPIKLPIFGEYTAGLTSWLPTLSALVRAARGGYSLAHEPADDQQVQATGGGGMGLLVIGGVVLWAITRRGRR